MIRIEGLTKRFKSVTAVSDLSLHVEGGEIFGFLGPNGAGKTTTIRILSTLTRPTSGRVRVNGFDVLREPIGAKEQIGVIHQTHNIDPDLTGYQNLLIHGLFFRMTLKEIRSRAHAVLDIVDLTEAAHRHAATYSGGMRRKLTIARALLHDPALLIMDEPTVGLDALTRRRMWDLIRQLRKRGATIFLTTHYIEEAEQLSDRVGIIDRGKLIALGTPAALTGSLGKVAVEVEGDAGLEVEFFPDRDRASAWLSSHDVTARIRNTNLEDVFISLTGKRVIEEENG
jgi:ABC-2 type transport system ATP-binding protein